MEMGLLTWHLVRDEFNEPDLDGCGRRWCRSPRARGLVRDALESWLSEPSPNRREIAEGAAFAPFVHEHGAHRFGVSAVLLADERFLESDLFRGICASAAVARDEAAEALQPHLVRSDALGLERLLHDHHRTLIEAARNEVALDTFSDELAQSYEEIALFYRLGRSMTQTSDPLQFVEQTCHEVCQTLPFDWICVIFTRPNRFVAALSGRQFLAGSHQAPRLAFELEVAAQLKSMQVGERPALLASDESGLPALVGAEVIANPITHDGKVVGAILAGNKTGPDPEVRSAEMNFLEASADLLGIYHENMARFTEQRSLFLGTLGALTASIDAKDRYTRGHSERVALLAGLLAGAAGFDTETVECYRIGGLVHDVGKIGIPEAVLCKKGRLTDEQFAQIQQHPVIGHQILKDIPPLARVLPGVLHHHEKWDGSGYPYGLSGERIPQIARVLCVADSFDAMSSTRSYRPGMLRERVIAEFDDCAGTHFDPEWCRMIPKIDLTRYDELVARTAVTRDAA
ncbi:MAG: hypothetical protein CMJ18_03685 [Phycisphaeraceae bacterium]|nr:hypothetical protein [Phycisphaeraceae bacterium]